MSATPLDSLERVYIAKLETELAAAKALLVESWNDRDKTDDWTEAAVQAAIEERMKV